MSDKDLGEVLLLSRLNYAEQVTLTDGEGVNISPYSKAGPFPASLVPSDLPRGISKTSVGAN